MLWYIPGKGRVTTYMRLNIVIESSQNTQFSLHPHIHDAFKKSIEIIYCQIYTISPRGAIISIFILITMSISQEILLALENLRNCCNQILFLYYHQEMIVPRFSDSSIHQIFTNHAKKYSPEYSLYFRFDFCHCVWYDDVSLLSGDPL